MNAYLSLLRPMIENLPEQSPPARANVYSRARDKLIHELEKRQPPLSEEQIERQVIKMRDAIARIEQDYAADG